MKHLISIRDPSCELCKLHRAAIDVCVTGSGEVPARVMVVGKMPNSRSYQEGLIRDLEEAGLDPIGEGWFFTAALKCRNFDQNPSSVDTKACRVYIVQEIEVVKPEWILCLGNEALLSITGHSGITAWRGRELGQDLNHTANVFATISPSSVARNPGQRQAYLADLRLFGAQLTGKPASVAKPGVFFVDNMTKLKQLRGLLRKASLISYDIETRAGSMQEWQPDGVIVSLSGTMLIGADDRSIAWALPLSHPKSPFRTQWQRALRFIADDFSTIPKQIAQNGKFDARWLRHYGVRAKVTFDTMLAAHLLDENRQKGLKPQAASRLGVAPWSIPTKDLWSTPLRDVLEYNVLDTFYTYHIYLDMKPELLEQPRLTRIFTKILLPANEILIEAERHGVWVDRQKVATNRKIAADMVTEIDSQISAWIPDPEVTEDWPTYKNGKRCPINMNPSLFSKWLLFDHLGLPVLDRGKEKDDGSDGDASMREEVMLELKGTHPIVDKLLERSGWVKNGQFLSAYDDLCDEGDRLHTTFKLTGTVTGRLSSGKPDAEKVTVGANKLRGINLQQVPRDIFVRGVVGVPEGYVFVEVDFSQVELRTAAFMAPEPTMKRLYQTGQDIHQATASWVLGIPASRITKDERKKAKAVNFGFLYGMGARKFVQTAFLNYQAVFTLDEAYGIRKEFFRRFPALMAWHARQRRLAYDYGRVQSPIGRIRHLPDIYSKDDAVRGEAERQAINSPVQSFASDMNLMGMIQINKVILEQGLDAHVLGTIHDATLFEVREDQVKQFLPMVKYCYENLPLKRQFGVEMDVPIVADLKVGRFWGGSTELTNEQVYDWKGEGL